MGFTKPDLPPVDPDTFMGQPLMDRMKVLALRWVEHGFVPRRIARYSPRCAHGDESTARIGYRLSRRL